MESEEDVQELEEDEDVQENKSYSIEEKMLLIGHDKEY